MTYDELTPEEKAAWDARLAALDAENAQRKANRATYVEAMMAECRRRFDGQGSGFMNAVEAAVLEDLRSRFDAERAERYARLLRLRSKPGADRSS